MSLKNLVGKIKKGGLSLSSTAEKLGDSKTPTARLEYDVEFTTLDKLTMTAILETMLDSIKRETGADISDPIKKSMLLKFYRLAFSQDARLGGHFHPSEISLESSPCRRKMYFQKASLKKDATFVPFTSDNKMQRLCDLGTMVHLYIQENLMRKGVLKDFEVSVLAPEYGIAGKMDGVIEFYGEDDLGKFYDAEDMVLEVKTINDYGFNALRYPKTEHIKQASIYGGILGYKRICFLYYNKNTSALKFFVAPVDEEYVENFKELASGIIKEYNSQVRKTRSNDLNLHSLPKKICPNRTCQRAVDCAYVDSCFGFKN